MNDTFSVWREAVLGDDLRLDLGDDRKDDLHLEQEEHGQNILAPRNGPKEYSPSEA